MALLHLLTLLSSSKRSFVAFLFILKDVGVVEIPPSTLPNADDTLLNRLRLKFIFLFKVRKMIALAHEFTGMRP